MKEEIFVQQQEIISEKSLENHNLCCIYKSIKPISRAYTRRMKMMLQIIYEVQREDSKYLQFSPKVQW